MSPPTYAKLGFGYDFGALKNARNPFAQAYFTIFKNSPETLLATLLMASYPILEQLPFSWIKRSDDAKNVIVNAAAELIAMKTAEGAQENEQDILGCMLQENKKLESVGEQGLEIISQIPTFLTAGYTLLQVRWRRHETTSTALAWTLYELTEHPEVQTRLREEIRSVLGKTYDPHHSPTYDQIEQMKYLNNVCREVLRINPPGIIPKQSWLTPVPITIRQAVVDDIYEGIKIPQNTLIHFPHLVINTHPSIWGPDAEQFRPERWDRLKDVSPTQFLTFQHGTLSLSVAKLGPYACIGRKFAEMEMKVVLAVLVGSFEFERVVGRNVEKHSLITMRPKNGMYLHVSKVA